MTRQPLHKAIRDASPLVRRSYAAARKTSAIFRDWSRRAIIPRLPRGPLSIPHEAGFLVAPPHTLEGVNAVVQQARDTLVQFDRQRPPAGKNKKHFLVNVLYPDSLTLASPIMQFALSDEVLAVVSRYLGLAPLLTNISIFHSNSVDRAPTSSQLYHCDGDDVMQIKVFVYCSDVDTRSGPLTVLEAAATERVQKRTRYRFGTRLTDDQVHDGNGQSAAHAIVGPSGTVAFVDTSRCLHFGSRVAADAPPRLVTMIQYQTPYSFMLPLRYRDALPFRRLLDPSLGLLQRLVLGE